MSTNVNYAGAGSLPDACLPARRKADAMDSPIDDDATRSAKRCKRTEDIHQCFEMSSLNGSSKRRNRDEGRRAVKLRKRFMKSLRNIPAQSDSVDGAHFAFTFVPKPFAQRLDAMEDIEVSLPATDFDLLSQTTQSTVSSQQHHQVPMLIDGSQIVETVGLSEASASISTLDTEMEIVSEHVLALDAAASSFGDEDEVMADASQVIVPAGPKSFISRFLARAVVAVPRQTTQLKGVVRGIAKSSSRKFSAISTPYARTRRPEGLTPAPRVRGSLMVPDNLFCRLATTTERIAAKHPLSTSTVLKPIPSNEDIVASTVEDVVLDIPVEIREESPAPIDVIDCLALEGPLADIMLIAEVQELPAPLSPVHVAVESDEDVFGPVSLVSQSEAEAMEIQVFYDASEDVEDEVMHEGDAFFSLPPSPSPSSPQLFSTTLDRHCDDDTCIACLLLTDLAQTPISPPSLCNTDSEDSSAYGSEIDEYYIDAAPYNVVADPAIWLYRDSPVLLDLEDDVVVAVPVEEMLDVEILPLAADPRLVSLISHLDKWSCEDNARVLPTTSCADVLMTSDSDVWYDAMDDSVSPTASLSDIQMTCDASYTDFMDGILVDRPHYSATGLLADLDYVLPGHPLTTIGDYNMTTQLGSPFEPRWSSPFLAQTARHSTADTPLMGSDACSDSLMDLDVASAPHYVLVPGPGYDTTPAQLSCLSRLSEDDLTLAMLVDAPSLDLMDTSVSWVSTPVPSPVFPGAWREDFEFMDDILS
ncbi:hypothetical protein VTO73DRAFT_5882 [Trametes versicolor]